MSNKPLDNRSIARRSHARRRRVAIRITAAVRDVFTLIDSDRDRYLATGAALQLHIALSLGDASLHNSQIVDSDRDRYVIDDECVHVIELLQIIIAPPCTYCETHAH